jgi:hypothetical protein
MSQSLQKLIAQVDALAERHSQPGFEAQCGHLIGSVVSFGLIAPFGKADPKRLKDAEVSDKWLAAVAAEPHASAIGLHLLSDALTFKGRVTVAEAVQWAAIERAHLGLPPAEASVSAPTATVETLKKGALALLARVSRLKR